MVIADLVSTGEEIMSVLPCEAGRLMPTLDDAGEEIVNAFVAHMSGIRQLAGSIAPTAAIPRSTLLHINNPIGIRSLGFDR